MARNNYSFEKRRREIEKRKKKEQKLLKRRMGSQAVDSEAVVDDTAPAEGTNAPTVN